MDRTLATKLHEGAGNLPRAWEAAAEDLLAAAQILKERHESFDRESLGPGDSMPPESGVKPVELMLRGMAIECMLKALWVKQGNAIVRAGKYLGVHGAGQHDLPQLASATGFQIDAVETDLLRRLSHFIQYGGRYPVPRDASQLRLIRSAGGGRGAATSWSTPTDQNSFDEIVRRLGTLL